MLLKAGDNFLSLSTDHGIRAVILTVNNIDYPVWNITMANMDEQYGQKPAVSGRPILYSIYSGGIKVWPTADRDYELVIDYY